MIQIPVTSIVSRNCGGHGAWLDNPLGTPKPGNEDWLGFQFGGGGRNRKPRKTRQVRKRRISHKTRRKAKKRHHKFR
jgi:hypothetical protein